MNAEITARLASAGAEKTDPSPARPLAGEAKLPAALERLRSEARCANELERGHILWRLGRDLGVEAGTLLGWGFDAAYGRMMKEER